MAATHDDRLAAIQAAKKLLDLQPVILDTETTGLDWRAEVIEVAVIDHDDTALVDTLVQPTGPIPSAATRVHGITEEMVREAPAWPEAWDQVAAAIQGRQVVIYNAEFDLKVMQQSHWRHRLTWDPPYRDQECLMKLYARFVGQRHPAYGSYRWQSLEDAARQCGLDHPNAHRAAADARLTRALLHYLALMA